MVQLNLKGLYWSSRKRKDGSGTFYYYAWKSGPLILKSDHKLKSAPPELIEAYQKAHKDRKTPRDTSFVSALIREYRGSNEWKNLTAKSKKEYNRHLENIFDRFATLPIESLNDRRIRKHFIAFRDQYAHSPRCADYAITVLKRLLNFAKDRGHIDFNRAEGITRLYSVNKSDKIWTQEDIENACQQTSPEVTWAIHLAAFTGLRLSDLIALTWNDIQADHIVIKTSKGRGKRTARIPLLPETEALLEQIPKRAVQVLTNTHGNPWTVALGQRVSKAAKAAGVQRTTHDLRRTFATRLAAAGIEDEKIADIMGWGRETVAHLRKIYVDQASIMRSIREQIESKSV